MEPQPPPSSTPPPQPAPPRADAGTANLPAESPSEPLPNADIRICPVCREPRAEDARFCEECGHDYGGQPTPREEERGLMSGPLLWAILVFWIVVIVGGLYFLYNALWAI